MWLSSLRIKCTGIPEPWLNTAYITHLRDCSTLVKRKLLTNFGFVLKFAALWFILENLRQNLYYIICVLLNNTRLRAPASCCLFVSTCARKKHSWNTEDLFLWFRVLMAILQIQLNEKTGFHKKLIFIKCCSVFQKQSFHSQY